MRQTSMKRYKTHIQRRVSPSGNPEEPAELEADGYDVKTDIPAREALFRLEGRDAERLIDFAYGFRDVHSETLKERSQLLQLNPTDDHRIRLTQLSGQQFYQVLTGHPSGRRLRWFLIDTLKKVLGITEIEMDDNGQPMLRLVPALVASTDATRPRGRPSRKRNRTRRRNSQTRLTYFFEDWFIIKFPSVSCKRELTAHIDNARHGAVIVNLHGWGRVDIHLKRRSYQFRVEGKMAYFIKAGVLHQVVETSGNREVMVFFL